ncbi:MAG: dihydroneopterin aldolase [Hyphomonadaceae bacterium]|nr:MAG: dihydroneopterin aldolase [Caulobacteraceae bacterium]MBT9447191.1 dihydroneopterin aldolase [Hyphomonadaceae bacterium]TPW08214.1 MAG: dihydroneopterin aldolase [Alphaproteobacteria bacterium]
MTVRVLVSNLIVHGHHGVADAEKTLGQKFEVDIDCHVRRPNPADDTMRSTVCYSELCDIAIELSNRVTFNLIETFAYRLIDEIFERFASVERVRVCLRKPSAPIRHSLDHVGVELERARDT